MAERRKKARKSTAKKIRSVSRSRKGKVGRKKGFKHSAATIKKIAAGLRKAWKEGRHKGNSKKGGKKRVHSGSKKSKTGSKKRISSVKMAAKARKHLVKTPKPSFPKTRSKRRAA